MYATKGDVENIFGATNIGKWADLDNDEDGDKIEARIEWALSLAESRINSKLRHGPYQIPFECAGSGSSSGSGGTPDVPLEIIDITARDAGVALYDGRRITDSPEDNDDELSTHRKSVKTTIKQILAGQLRLDCVVQVKTYPQAIPI